MHKENQEIENEENPEKPKKARGAPFAKKNKTFRKWPYPIHILLAALTKLAALDLVTTDDAIEFVAAVHSPPPRPLPKSSPKPRGPPQSPKTEKERHKAIIKHIKESDFLRASKELERMRLAPINDITTDKLHALYPRAAHDDPSLEPLPEIESPIRVTPEELREELRNMKFAAPGPSRLTVAHLKQLIDYHPSVLAAFTLTANYILRGKAISDPRLEQLRTAIGVALIKNDHPNIKDEDMKLRPIGINEVFINLVARLALRKTKDKISDKLDLLDMGFNRPGGTEAIVHAAQAAFNHQIANKGHFLVLQTDFENAFNSVSRQSVFALVRETCPELLPLVQFRYNNLKVVFGRGDDQVTIHSESGVSQGCPLSPALFQLVMSKAMARARELDATLAMSYLDDNSIIMKTPTTALEALTRIQADASQHGLKLNITKSSMFWHHGEEPLTTDESDALACLKNKNIQYSEEGTSLLGGNIGSRNFVAKGAKSNFLNMQAKVKRFQEVINFSNSRAYMEEDGDPLAQKTLKLIRYCICTLPTYTLRTTDPATTEELAYNYDIAVAQCLMHLLEPGNDLNRHRLHNWFNVELENVQQKNDLADPDHFQCVLDRIFLRRGGVGLSSARFAAAAAYLGSIALTAATIEKAMAKIAPNLDRVAVRSLLAAQQQEEELRNEHEHRSNARIAVDGLFPVFNPDKPRRGVQKKLTNITKSKKYEKVKEYIKKRKKDAPGRLRKFEYASQPEAGAWMEASTKLQANILSDQIVRDELLKSTGLQPSIPAMCKVCRKGITDDSSENHSVVCGSRNGGSRKAGTIIEVAIYNGLKPIEQEASRNPRMNEQMGFQKKDVNKKAKSLGDIKSYHLGRAVILDVVMTAGRRTLHEAEMTKEREYTSNRNVPKGAFIPLAISGEGAWGEKMVKYFKEARDAMIGVDANVKTKFRFAREAISIGVCKAMHVYMSRIREGETMSKDGMDGECDLDGSNEENAGDDSIQAVGPLFIDQFSTSTTYS